MAGMYNVLYRMYFFLKKNLDYIRVYIATTKILAKFNVLYDECGWTITSAIYICIDSYMLVV